MADAGAPGGQWHERKHQSPHIVSQALQVDLPSCADNLKSWAMRPQIPSASPCGGRFLIKLRRFDWYLILVPILF